MIIKERSFTGTDTLVMDFFESTGSIIKIRKGQFLFKEGLTANKLHLVKSGKFQVTKNTLDGKELFLSITSENELLGDFSLFNKKAKYTLNAKALETSEVYTVEYTAIENQILKGGNFAVELIKVLNLHNKRNESKFRDLVLYGKKGALYSTLIRLSNSYGIVQKNGVLINLRLTNMDLANFCGTARESISRMLTEIKNSGIISVEDGKIVIHDLDFLRDEINCEDCPFEICSIF